MTPYVQDSDFTLHVGDALEVLATLPDESVHCVVTSPPYWGLRDYSVDGQLGLEATPDEFVTRMVDVFREVRRVLRRDGTCWVNLGDSYVSNGFFPDAPSNQGESKSRSHARGGRGPQITKARAQRFDALERLSAEIDHAERRGEDLTAENLRLARAFVAAQQPVALKSKDLVGIPWRVAFALQADGWYLRSDIIWSKPNPMPESVTDRPTKAHEYVFLLTKSPRYFFDQEAVRETDGGKPSGNGFVRPHRISGGLAGGNPEQWKPGTGRNVRSVWEIATQPYPEAHFATFPEALPERCIKAGTSERGCCPECGAPWEREVASERTPTGGTDGGWKRLREGDHRDSRSEHDGQRYDLARLTTGWCPSCACGSGDLVSGAVGVRNAATEPPQSQTTNGHVPTPVPCTVLDPFMGSGTTALVARRLGLRSIGIELNQEYAELCARRLQQLSLLA